MVLTVQHAIKVLSNGMYTVGPNGTLSTEDADSLEELLAPEINRRNPGFTGAELLRFKAYLMLDAIANSSGSGQLIEKKIKDVQWKIARSQVKGSSSVWYDFAEKMVANFNKDKMPSGVARADAYVKGLDSTTIPQYGDPSDV